MTDYRTIQGSAVQSRTASTGLIEGEIWYDSSAGNFKLEAFDSGVWSTGGAYPTGLYGMAAGGSTPDAVAYGGGTGPTPSYSNQSATYNGTSWTAAPTVPFTHSLGGGTGPGAAAIGGGGDGNAPGAFAEWDDSSWTATPTMGKNAYQCRLAGTQTAAVAAGLYYDSSAQTWNGTTWSDPGAAMPVHVYNTGAVGTSTAASFIGGHGPIPTANAQSTQQEWDGSAWSTGTAMPGTGAPSAQTGNGAPNNDYWINGGGGTFLTGTTTAQFDGSSWTTAGSNPTAVSNAAGGGTDKSTGFIVGGSPTTTAMQEISGGVFTKTITTT